MGVPGYQNILSVLPILHDVYYSPEKSLEGTVGVAKSKAKYAHLRRRLSLGMGGRVFSKALCFSGYNFSALVGFSLFPKQAGDG